MTCKKNSDNERRQPEKQREESGKDEAVRAAEKAIRRHRRLFEALAKL
jgi:hypothetical protein